MFDKAAYHLDSVQRLGLDASCAGTHIGLFFGWAAHKGLTASWLEDRTPTEFAAFRAGDLSGPELLSHWDSALLDDMFTDEGLAFSASYLPPVGPFLEDYRATLAKDLPSPFHVQDTAENQAALNQVLDRRFETWHATWDPASGRPDLRSAKHQASGPPPLLGPTTLPVLPVSGGIPLPGGPLGIRATQPSTVNTLERANAGDGRLALFPTLSGQPARAPEDVGVIGVWAHIVEFGADDDGIIAAVLDCQPRIGRLRWVAEPQWLAEVRPLPDPTAEPSLAPDLEGVRHLVAGELKRRRERGVPLGLLALAPSMDGGQLLDAVAREVRLAFEEQLVVLESPSLQERADVVLAALRRLS